jgi:hypothetical protein
VLGTARPAQVRTQLKLLLNAGSAADDMDPPDGVEHCGDGKDFGHATRSVGNRELRQQRTRADGEARHGEQPEPLRARANTRLICLGPPQDQQLAVSVRNGPLCAGQRPGPVSVMACGELSELDQPLLPVVGTDRTAAWR